MHNRLPVRCCAGRHYRVSRNKAPLGLGKKWYRMKVHRSLMIIVALATLALPSVYGQMLNVSTSVRNQLSGTIALPTPPVCLLPTEAMLPFGDWQRRIDSLRRNRQAVPPQTLLSPPCRLRLDSLSTGHYGELCLSVRVSQFTDMLGFQLPVLFDTSHLRFVRNEFPLEGNEGLGPQFNTFPGVLLYSWISPSFSPVSIPQDETIIRICFEPRRAGISPVLTPPMVSFLLNGNVFSFPAEAVSGTADAVPFSTGQGMITVQPSLYVFPGDADANGLVNQYDVLYTGLAAGRFGPQSGPRPNAGIVDWYAQAAIAWGRSTPHTAVNFAHADADGDGKLMPSDIDAIADNYGQQAPFWPGGTYTLPDLPIAAELSRAPLFIPADTLYTSLPTAHYRLQYGNEDAAAQQVYGLAFSLTYPPEMIESGSFSLLPVNSWLGSPEELFFFTHTHAAEGRIDCAMVRRDGQARSGSGTIATLQWSPVWIAGALQLPLSIDNCLVMTAEERAVPVAVTNALIPLRDGAPSADSQQSGQTSPLLFPNPTTDWLQIQWPEEEVATVSCWNTQGKMVMLHILNRKNPTLDMRQLPAGHYMLHVRTRQKTHTGWLVKH